MDKLIVCSVVRAGKLAGTADTAIVQAWTVASLAQNLDDQRRDWQEEFLPVAAVVADVDLMKSVLDVDRFPASMALSRAAQYFRHLAIESPAQRAIFNHYSKMQVPAGDVFAAWERAVAAVPGPPTRGAVLLDRG